MSINPNKRPPYPVIPAGEKKCIWMEAGVISYKICDYDMNCEYCPFDRAMRGLESGSPFSALKGPAAQVVEHLSRFEVDGRRHYHPGHTWVKVEEPGRVRVGLDGLAAMVLETLDALVLPFPGERVLRDAPCGEFVQGNRCYSLFSPLTGVVRTVNYKALSAPAQLLLSPLDEGWLVEVEPDDLPGDLARCRTGRSAMSWCLKVVDWAGMVIGAAIEKARAELGPTLYDGGALTGGVRDILPDESYERLVMRLLSAREEWWGVMGEPGPLEPGPEGRD